MTESSSQESPVKIITKPEKKKQDTKTKASATLSKKRSASERSKKSKYVYFTLQMYSSRWGGWALGRKQEYA